MGKLLKLLDEIRIHTGINEKMRKRKHRIGVRKKE